MFEGSHTVDTVSALEQVAARLGLSVDGQCARRAREQTARLKGGWQRRLVAAGAILGMRITFIETAGDQARQLAEAHGPLIGWDDDEQRYITTPGPDAAAGGTWAVVEPALPLDPKGDEPSTPQRRLFGLLRDERPDVKVVVSYAAAIGLLSLAVPIAVQALVNSVAFGTVVQPVVVLTIMVAVALGFAGALKVLQATVVEWMQQRMFVRVATDMAVRLASVRRDALGSAYAPELANRFFDVVTVQKSAATLLLDGVALALQTVVGLVLLAFYHPLLLAFDAVLLLLIAFVVFGLGQGAIETSIKESKAKYAMASWLEEIARHPTTFRSAHGRALALDRVDELATRYLNYRGKHWKILVRQIAGTKILQALASAALLGVGALLVIQRQLTLGQLVAAELIVTSVLAGIAKFGKHLESYYDLVTAVDKLGQVVDLPREPSGGEAFVDSADGVEVSLRSVCVRSGSAPIDLTIAKGHRVSIRGANGSGKSTIVDVLYGLHAPSSGAALVDGVDLRTLDRATYRARVAVVRGNEAFEGTVAENVRVGRVGMSDADVRGALADVGLLDDVLALPEGAATGITPEGFPLSSGQTRMLMLARAIVGKPRLLILDEALDGVDDAARARIVNAIFARSTPWTVLVTTHVADIAALCDERYRIERGALIEDRT